MIFSRFQAKLKASLNLPARGCAMSYEPVFRADVGGFGPSETALGLGVARLERAGGLRQGDRGRVSSRSDAAGHRVLSESAAAVRMGVSEARLREISDFHRELVGMGCRPFGRAPEQIGNQYFYSVETLEHWFSNAV